MFFLRIFESRNCDISEDITELIKQLLNLYEALTERYSECVNWLEEDRNDNIVFDANLNPSTKAMQGQEHGRGLEFLGRKSKRPWFYVVKDCSNDWCVSNNIAQAC